VEIVDEGVTCWMGTNCDKRDKNDVLSSDTYTYFGN